MHKIDHYRHGPGRADGGDLSGPRQPESARDRRAGAGRPADDDDGSREFSRASRTASWARN